MVMPQIVEKDNTEMNLKYRKKHSAPEGKKQNKYFGLQNTIHYTEITASFQGKYPFFSVFCRKKGSGTEPKPRGPAGRRGIEWIEALPWGRALPERGRGP